MGDVFTTLDFVFFFAVLAGVMVVGLIAGRQENTSEDYFLAGRRIPWWGVAGSIFGSNVSANHLVGMMGIGFSIGFYQSHFELGAIVGLMALCYGFLPVYRKLNLYTLSEYLGKRYDDRSRVAYAIIMVLIMVVVQMVPGLYIGARTICILLGGDAMIGVNANENYYVGFVIALAVISASYTIFGGLKAVVWTDFIQSLLMLAVGIGIALVTFYKIGGWGEMMALDHAAGGAHKMHLYQPMNHSKLPWTGVLTGLMALHCFYWGTNQFIVQRALAARSDAEGRMGIVAAGFLKLLIPFFAIGTGVAAFYLFETTGPGQDIGPDTTFAELVKVVIPTRIGLIGLISAGLIGAILSSIDSMMNSAATIVTVDVYKRYLNPTATDRQMIFVGRLSILLFVIVAAWMAINVLDPNSEENFFLQIVDYEGYLTPGLLVAFVMGMFWRRGTATGAFVTILAGVFFSWSIDAAYDKFHGMHPAIYSIATGEMDLQHVELSDLPEEMRTMSLEQREAYVKERKRDITPINSRLGAKLNFLHRVGFVIVLCVLLHLVVSLRGRVDAEKSRLVWTDLSGHSPRDFRNLLAGILISIIVFAALGILMYNKILSPTLCAVLAAVWTLGLFAVMLKHTLEKYRAAANSGHSSHFLVAIVCEDRFWAGLLCALAVFMHYYFY